jgi:hypothetical protein
MTLPEELPAVFDQEIAQYEEEMKMPYITSIERRSEQRGELKGKQELITRLLNRRFGEIIVAIAFGTALRAIAMSPRRKGDTSCDRFDMGVIWRETQRNLRILSGGICS